MKNHYKNLLNEMLSNKSRFGPRKDLAIHQARRVRKMLDAHSKSMFGNPAAGSPENMAKLERLNLMARSQGADTAVRNAVIVAPKDGRTTDAYPNLVPVGADALTGALQPTKVNFAALSDKERIDAQRRLDSIRRQGLKTRRQKATMATHQAALDARAQEFTMEGVQKPLSEVSIGRINLGTLARSLRGLMKSKKSTLGTQDPPGTVATSPVDPYVGSATTPRVPAMGAVIKGAFRELPNDGYSEVRRMSRNELEAAALERTPEYKERVKRFFRR